MWFSERWLASAVAATNPDEVSAKGSSIFNMPGKSVPLMEARGVRPEAILAQKLADFKIFTFPVQKPKRPHQKDPWFPASNN
jgi:hypothetical protein